MDHMMPELDGIETVRGIRAWEETRDLTSGTGNLGRRVPIVALTANVVAGMRELFLKTGFNDFLAKPVDVSRLDDIMGTWIPRDKWEKPLESGDQKDKNSPPRIPGVNTKQGILMTGGSLPAYWQVLALFRQDVEQRLPLLRDFPPGTGLGVFNTQVHSIRSASAYLGAAEISSEAARLEAAGKAEDLAFIRDSLPAFVERLEKLAGDIGRALEESAAERAEAPAPEDAERASAAILLLEKLQQALGVQNALEIDLLLEALDRQPLDPVTREALGRISQEVLMAEFDGAAKIVSGLTGEPQKTD
jgi:CheY-like chemotaxis protein